MLGSDGCVYSTQTPNVGSWVAPIHRPPSLQKTHPSRQGRDPGDRGRRREVRRAQRPRLWARRSSLLHRLRRLGAGREAPSRADRRRRESGKAHILEELDHIYPNGIVAEPDGPLVWVESYTRNVVRRKPDGSKADDPHYAGRAYPRRAENRREGDFWITAVAAGGVDLIDRTGKPLHFLETGGTILNCVFGKGGVMFCCDMGPFDVTGAAMTGRLIKVDVGVEGMPLFRGAIGQDRGS